MSLVIQAIDAVLKDKGSDASHSTEALAAIESLARLRGHPGFSNAYTDTVDQWVLRTRLSPSHDLVAKALKAIDRILGKDSELRELWEEADEAAAWTTAVHELKNRLLAEPRPVRAAAATAHQTSVARADDGDEVDAILQRIGALDFSLPAVPADATVAELLRAVHAAGALGAGEQTRYAISRIWRAVAQLNKENILWDLAVREAQSWAVQGLLPEALEGLEPWRASPAASAPGNFESRASGVCLSGGDVQRARELRAQACAAKPDSAMERVDRALLEARLGSAELAQAILAAEAIDALPEEFGLFITFIRGILACRNEQPAALALLTAATGGFLVKSHQSPAAWPLLSISCAWWALALAHSGRQRQATDVLRSIAPILLQPHQREILLALREKGLLPADAAIPQIPSAPANATARSRSGTALEQADGFKVVRVRGVNALQWVHFKRREFAQGSRLYPFLIGDDKDYEELRDQLAPPADGGQSTLAAAHALDVAQWIAQHSPKSAGRWPAEEIAAHNTPLTQFHTLSQLLKEEMVVGLIELDEPSELFARIGFGEFNGCPAAHVHTALHRHWSRRYGAEPIAVQGSVVECIVSRPPADRAAALALAREHRGYCDDIVEQGVGTTAKLATTLLGAPYWYFWWD
jgi:hypothetical protein